MKLGQINNNVLSDKDLALIEGYAQQSNSKISSTGSFFGRRVSHYSYDSLPFYSGNTYISNHKNYYNRPSISSVSEKVGRDTDKKDTVSYTTMFAVAALFSTAFYIITTLPRIYNLGKQYYYTGKVASIANRTATNPREIKVLENLKKLLESDRSKQFLRHQNVKTFTALGILSSSVAHLVTVKNTLPESITAFFSDNFPSRFPFVSKSLNEKMISFLTNENLTKFSKAAAVVSVSAYILSKSYDLYNNFFYDTENPRSYLRNCATEIRCSVNKLKYGTAATPYNAAIRILAFGQNLVY